MVNRLQWLRWLKPEGHPLPLIIMGRAVNTYDIEELRAAVGFLHRMLLWTAHDDLQEDEDIARVKPND